MEQETKIKFSDYVNTIDFLKKEDVSANKVWIVTHVVEREFDDGGKKSKKLALSLEANGLKKDFTLNTTNTKSLINMFGDDTSGVIGKSITLKLVETHFKGQPAEGIRIDVDATKSGN